MALAERGALAVAARNNAVGIAERRHDSRAHSSIIWERSVQTSKLYFLLTVADSEPRVGRSHGSGLIISHVGEMRSFP